MCKTWFPTTVGQRKGERKNFFQDIILTDFLRLWGYGNKGQYMAKQEIKCTIYFMDIDYLQSFPLELFDFMR